MLSFNNITVPKVNDFTKKMDSMLLKFSNNETWAVFASSPISLTIASDQSMYNLTTKRFVHVSFKAYNIAFRKISHVSRLTTQVAQILKFPLKDVTYLSAQQIRENSTSNSTVFTFRISAANTTQHKNILDKLPSGTDVSNSITLWTNATIVVSGKFSFDFTPSLLYTTQSWTGVLRIAKIGYDSASIPQYITAATQAKYLKMKSVR